MVPKGQMDEGLADLRVAATEKQTEEHGVIDEALGDRGEVSPPTLPYTPSPSEPLLHPFRVTLSSPFLLASSIGRQQTN